MFSALTQGSLIYLLEKTPEPKFKIGEVIGVSQPRINYSLNSQATIDLKAKIDDTIQEFYSIPAINTLISYNNGQLIISETKQGIQNEVEGILQNSQQILDNIDTYKKNVDECETILKQLNPQFARDKERDDRLVNLESRFSGVESKLDEIFKYIKK